MYKKTQCFTGSIVSWIIVFLIYVSDLIPKIISVVINRKQNIRDTMVESQYS
jgi:hypothetical protein